MSDAKLFASYERARKRVEATEALQAHRELLLQTDWPEGEEHYRWVADAKLDEILEWALSLGDQKREP